MVIFLVWKKQFLRENIQREGEDEENKTNNNNSNNCIEMFTSNIPLLTADIETSIRKKYSGGIGGRTIYSVGATKSTLPLVSSGR